MASLTVLLKNGKSVSAKGAPAQVIGWRTSLSNGETIQLPTDNGTFRVDGRAVGGMACMIEVMEEGDASAAMMAEPYTHYRCGRDIFQYSDMSKQFEKVESRVGMIYWKPTALPEGIYHRIGKDSIITTEWIRKTKEETELDLMRPSIYVRIEEEQEKMGWKHVFGWIIRKLRGERTA